ncbi:hypothetical protein EHO59_12270 [Leptospira semungkisensis]|uniref:Uncharacterized protein n=1 Tax=Leptospira semungkisensis TaxID=2484985 RepID=A0A4R9FQ72_9LEPT|nr:hypothetical protein [Leptospira semungkisensis]TGK00711.1 hypothetical protein EHO59_12270 [Leptospira semungkisensis]
MKKGYKFLIHFYDLQESERNEKTSEFIRLGYNVSPIIKPSDWGFIVDLFDDDPDYKTKLAYLLDQGKPDKPKPIVEYSKNEMEGADFFRICLYPSFGLNWPEPRPNYFYWWDQLLHYNRKLFGFRNLPEERKDYDKIFYDQELRSEENSFQLVQVAELSVNKVSKKLKGIFGLSQGNTAEHILVNRDLYEKHIKPLGIGSRPILDRKRQKKIEHAVQLLPQGISPKSLQSGFEFQAIGKNKVYMQHPHIPFSGYSKEIGMHYFETSELFEDRIYGVSYRLPIISKKLYDILLSHANLENVSCIPFL